MNVLEQKNFNDMLNLLIDATKMLDKLNGEELIAYSRTFATLAKPVIVRASPMRQESKVQKIKVRLVEKKTGLFGSTIIEEMTVEEFDAMNEAAEDTPYVYIQVN